MNENAPVNGRIRSLKPAETSGAVAPDKEQFDTVEALLRLVVGGALAGSDELRARLERWQEAASAPTQTAAQVAPLPFRSAHNPMRHALVGMLFEAESRMRRRFSTMRDHFWRLRDEARLYSTTLMPDTYTYWSPFDPLRMRLDAMRFHALETVDRWIELGWDEEERGRRMARQAALGVVDELLNYMARNPEVRHLIEQQGMSMADTAVDEVRGRTAAADMWIERFARSLLRRPSSDSREGTAAADAETHQPTIGSRATPGATEAAPVTSAAIAGRQP